MGSELSTQRSFSRSEAGTARMVNQLDLSIARLRLFLAEVESREGQVRTLQRQLRDQLERVIGFALYKEPTLDRTLNLMEDIEQRAESAEHLAQRLGRLETRVRAELESLQLTRDVQNAKNELAFLEAQRAQMSSGPQGGSPDLTAPSLADLEADIRRLQTVIHDASERAAQRVAAPKQ